MTTQDHLPASTSELSRLWGIFWEPRSVYQELAQRPRWWVPLILLSILSVVYITTFARRIGWERFLEQEFARNPRLQQLPVEQRAQILLQQQRIVGVSSTVAAAAGTAAATLLVAWILGIAFRVFAGAELRFSQAFSITCYSWLPWGLYTLLALLVMVLGDPETFDLRNPLAVNVGWYLDVSRTPSWLYTIASAIDIFSFWVIGLLALGFSVAGRKVSFRKSLLIVSTLWAVYVVGRAGLATIF